MKFGSLCQHLNILKQLEQKWVFQNKADDKGKVVCNKTRLVAKSYSQEEGIDYDGTYACGARLESNQIITCICLLQF